MSLISSLVRRAPRAKVELGWCELIDIPSLNLHAVRAKMDSGAATSSIHATRIKLLDRDGVQHVEFWFRQRAGDTPKRMEAKVIDHRIVRSSNGERQERIVIAAQFKLGNHIWEGQLTLANRRDMQFPILIGRRALRRGYLVNAGRKWVLGKPE